MFIINENVLICAIVKDCGERLKNNINLSIETGKIFKKYKIVIYENNSTDDTKNILEIFKNNEKIKIISEDISNEVIRRNSKVWSNIVVSGVDKPCKMEQTTNARNKVLDEIRKKEYNEYTYVIWIDLDSHGWFLKGIIDSFIKKNMWDVIYANGLDHNSHKYNDMYSYRDLYFLFGPELLHEYFWNIEKEVNVLNTEGLVPVFSAFGGIGIFKKSIFDNRKYECVVNEHVKIFYRKILHKYKRNFKNAVLKIIENSQISTGYKDEQSNIFWKANSGYDQPVISEHVALNLELVNNKYKIFINPKMIYYS